MNNFDMDQFSNRLCDLDRRLDKILDGEKLYLDPEKPDDALLIQQIHNFYPEDHDKVMDRSLDSPPQAYYITPDIAGTPREKKRLEISTQVHPLHERFISTQEIFLRNCSKLNQIHNVVMAGADLHFRDRRDYQEAFDRSENFFLHKRGDVVSLSQTIKLLRNIVDGKDTSERSIVIDNPNGRFTPTLEFLGIEGQDGVSRLNDALKANKIKTLIGLVEQTGTGISKVHELGIDNRRRLPVLPPLFEENLFFDTSSDEKIKDTRGTLIANRSDIEIKHANELTGHSEHDSEFKWSFGGNALAKGITTLKDKLASGRIDDDLAGHELSRKNGFLLFADGGEYYEEKGLADTQALSSVKGIVHPDIEYPGSETKPWSQGLGNKGDTYIALARAKEELEKKTGHKVSARSIDNCVAVVIPIHQDDINRPRYYAVKASTKMDTVFEPQPAHHIHYTQRHFQRFETCDQTLAELEDDGDSRLIEELAISKAMRGIMNAARVPKKFIDLKASFDSVKDVEVVCPWRMDSIDAAADLREQLKNAGFKPKIMENSVNSFDDVRRVMKKSNALFFPNIVTGEKENFWMSRILLPASVLVGKQLRDPSVNGNPMVMFSGTEERCEFEGILDHLKRSGMVTQDLHFLYNRSAKMSSAMRFIKEQSQHHTKYDDYHSHKFQDLPKVDRDVVAYLLSASSAHSVDNENSFVGAVNFALNGFDLCSGMGSNAPMGWHVWGGLQAKREGFDVNVQGVQDPYAMKTEGWPLEEMNKFMGKGHAVVAPDIFVRIWQILEMEKLKQNSQMQKLVITQANGIGGLQEIASLLALKEAQVAGTDRMSLIIENTQRATASGSVYRPHDALLDLLDRRGELDEGNGIYVSSHPQETMAIASRITGKELKFFDVSRPADTLFPFAREKNDYYDWLMHEGASYSAPSRTIRSAYDEVRLKNDHHPEMAMG